MRAGAGPGRGSSRLGQCLHPLSTQEGLGPGRRWGQNRGVPCTELSWLGGEEEVAESVWAEFRSGPQALARVGGEPGSCCRVTGEIQGPRGSTDTLGLRQGAPLSALVVCVRGGATCISESCCFWLRPPYTLSP